MSRSKKKGCNPLAAVLIMGCLLLVALVVVLFGGKIALEKWVQSDDFEDLVRKKAAKELHADVEIEDREWKGMQANIGKLTAKGYEEAAFSSIELNAIRASLKSMANKTVQISDINITRADIEFSNDRLKRTVKANAVSEEAVVTADATPKIPGFLSKFAPEKVALGDVVIGSVSLNVKDDAGESLVMIKDSKAQITPNLENKSAEFRIKDGDIVIAKAPEMTLRDAKMRWQDQSLFINNGSIGIYGEGHIAGSGEVAFKDSAQFDLDLNLSSIDVKKVVPEDWQKRISGTVRGPVKVKGPAADLIQEGTLHLDDGVLEGVEVLDKIAKFTKSDKFNRIVLNQAQSDFTMQGGLLELRNIEIQSDGLLRIEGKLDKDGKDIAGSLRLGVTPGTIRLIPGAKDRVFTDSHDGFLWTTVNIGGTTDKISEDLTSRLISAATGGLVDALPSGLLDTIKGAIGLGGENKEQEADPAKPDAPRGGIGGLIEGVIKDRVEDNPETIEKGKKILELFGPLLRK